MKQNKYYIYHICGRVIRIIIIHPGGTPETKFYIFDLRRDGRKGFKNSKYNSKCIFHCEFCSHATKMRAP